LYRDFIQRHTLYVHLDIATFGGTGNGHRCVCSYLSACNPPPWTASASASAPATASASTPAPASASAPVMNVARPPASASVSATGSVLSSFRIFAPRAHTLVKSFQRRPRSVASFVVISNSSH
jgi:hypothetical protein